MLCNLFRGFPIVVFECRISCYLVFVVAATIFADDVVVMCSRGFKFKIYVVFCQKHLNL